MHIAGLLCLCFIFTDYATNQNLAPALWTIREQRLSKGPRHLTKMMKI